MENIEKAKVFSFGKSVDYSAEAIVSKTIIRKETGNVTLFAFDQGQALSEHTAPFDALVQIIEGEAEIIINKVTYHMKEGESIIMPENIPHGVNAIARFKMLLTMIKEKS